MSNENEDSLKKIINTPEKANAFMRELNACINEATPERLMTIQELLVGKDMLVMSDLGEVRLTVKKVEFRTHTVELGPSTPENDWYPPSYDVETIAIIFTNNFTKDFKSWQDIKVYSK